MSRADIEAAAEEKYPVEWASDDHTASALADMRAAYVQGRLDQAEADAKLAETSALGYDVSDWDDVDEAACNRIAVRIGKGVE